MRRLAALASCLLAVAFATFVSGAAAAAPVPAFALPLEGFDSVAGWDGATGFESNPALGGLRYPVEASFALTGLEHGADLFRAVLVAHGAAFDFARRQDDFVSAGAGFNFGDERLHAGYGVKWLARGNGGAWDATARAGLLSRPAPWLSLGAVAENLTQARVLGARTDRAYTLGAALRPLAWSRARAHDLGPRLTLAVDAAIGENAERGQTRVRFGAELEIVPGVALRAMGESRGGFSAGFSLASPRSAYRAHAAYDRAERRTATTHVVAFHDAEDRTVLASARERRVATLRLGGFLADESLSDASLLGGGSTVSTARVRLQLDRALEDPLTRGVLLELRGVSGMAQLEELRAKILKLRAAGKPVVAHLEYGGGRGDLFLAAACDRAFASDEAFFAGLGLRAERRNYRTMLDSLGVKVDRASIGKYKSAYRNYSVDSTSDADRESIEHLLDASQELFVSTVSAGRGIPRESLLAALDGRSWDAQDLARLGVIDSVGYRGDALRALGALSGLRAKPRALDLLSIREAKREWMRPTGLAVVYASGGIEPGRSGGDFLNGPYMGSETVVRQLESAFRRRDVKAVVLRVESPGGSANASDLIHHATLELSRETRKPFVVSMGNVAASGGYHIACGANAIFAGRASRTGSIGVVFVKPSLEGFYARHNVRQDVFQRGAWMGGVSGNADWTPQMQASADSSVARSYEKFLAKVAAGRKLTRDQVHEVAQGRVWLGEDARARGLIDRIGGLDEAILEARRLARIPEAERLGLAEYRRPRPAIFERVLASAIRDAVTRAIRDPGRWGPAYLADSPLLDE